MARGAHTQRTTDDTRYHQLYQPPPLVVVARGGSMSYTSVYYHQPPPYPPVPPEGPPAPPDPPPLREYSDGPPLALVLIVYILLMLLVTYCCVSHFHPRHPRHPRHSIFIRVAKSKQVGWIDAEVHQHVLEEKSTRRTSKVAPEQYSHVPAALERLNPDGKHSSAEAVAALAELKELAGTAEESQVFVEAGGTRLLLERLRVCPPSQAEDLRAIIRKLANPKSLHEAARGDEAERDAQRQRLADAVTGVFACIFTVLAIGVLLFLFSSLIAATSPPSNGELPEDHHHWLGTEALGWMLLILVGFAVVLSLPLNRAMHTYQLLLRQQLHTLDREVEELLADGTLRLLDVEWIKATPLPRLLRRQDLPPEAFVAPHTARRQYAERRRLVGVLSYRWLRPEHPDPCGQRLRTLKHLLTSTSLPIKSLFWDYASIPQRGVADDGSLLERTDEEKAQFSKGLSVMGNLYASFESTTVLQLKEVPAAPAEYDAASLGEFNMLPYDGSGWCNFEQGAASLVAGQWSNMRRTAMRLALLSKAMYEALGLLFGVIVSVFLCCWATHNSCLKEAHLSKESREQNRKTRGELFVRYALREKPPPTEAERQQQTAQLLKELTENKVKQCNHYFEPKLIEISDASLPQIPSLLYPPSVDELRTKVEASHFTGKGDHEMVIKMLDDFDRLLSGRLTKEQAQKRYGWMAGVVRTLKRPGELLIERALRREKTRMMKVSLLRLAHTDQIVHKVKTRFARLSKARRKSAAAEEHAGNAMTSIPEEEDGEGSQPAGNGKAAKGRNPSGRRAGSSPAAAARANRRGGS